MLLHEITHLYVLFVLSHFFSKFLQIEQYLTFFYIFLLFSFLPSFNNCCFHVSLIWSNTEKMKKKNGLWRNYKIYFLLKHNLTNENNDHFRIFEQLFTFYINTDRSIFFLLWKIKFNAYRLLSAESTVNVFQQYLQPIIFKYFSFWCI